jgi:mRNA interferase MazF
MGERELNDYSSATGNSGRIWRLRIRQIPSEVVLTPEDGMPKVCAINLDHVQTVTKAKVGPFITALSDAQMDRVKNALLFALGF